MGGKLTLSGVQRLQSVLGVQTEKLVYLPQLMFKFVINIAGILRPSSSPSTGVPSRHSKLEFVQLSYDLLSSFDELLSGGWVKRHGMPVMPSERQ